MDSWDEWADKGYLKTAYRINNVILILSTILILVSVFIIKRAFESMHLFFILLLIPQFVLYGRQMKKN
jgi:hypothetical protein